MRGERCGGIRFKKTDPLQRVNGEGSGGMGCCYRMHARCGALANSWACDSQCRTERGHGQKPLSAAATSKAVKQLIAIKQPAGRWDAGQGWAHRDTWCGRRCLWGPRSPTQQGAIVTRLGEPGPPFWPWRGPPRKVGPPTVSVIIFHMSIIHNLRFSATTGGQRVRLWGACRP